MAFLSSEISFTLYSNRLFSYFVMSYSAMVIGDCIRTKIKESAEIIGLPTFVVADAGRTEVVFPFFSVQSHTFFPIRQVKELRPTYAGFCWFENCPCCWTWFVSCFHLHHMNCIFVLLCTFLNIEFSYNLWRRRL